MTPISACHGTAVFISSKNRSRRVLRPYFSNPVPANDPCFAIVPILLIDARHYIVVS